MEKQTKSNNKLLRIIGISIPIALVAGTLFHIPQRLTIPYVILAALVLGSIVLWSHANKEAEGKEWWDDDNASGWRGY